MSDPLPPVPPPPEPGNPASATFAVDFNPHVAGDYNRDFGGKGTAAIHPEEPRFRFTGLPRRGLFLGKQPAQLVFRSDQILNVAQHDTGVSFATPLGKSGAKGKPFAFLCASAAEAAALVAALPPARDADFAASADFATRLAQLPGGIGSRSVTTFLILANVAVFIALGFAGAGWFDVASMRPYILYGANNGAATTDGEWWRLVSCMFIHFGLIHLLLNLWALFQVGPLVERLLGRALFTVMYLGSGLAGSLATLLWNGDKVWSAGASGAVFGVYGALLGYLFREKAVVPRGVFLPMLKSTLVFAGYNLFYGAVHPNIDNAAHLGGLVGGAVLGWLCARPLEPDRRQHLFASRLRAGVIAVILAVGVGIALAPRFDYRVADSLRWTDANASFIARETELLEKRGPVFAAYDKTRDPSELLAWLHEIIPFYESWAASLSRLDLTPGFRLTRTRDEFVPLLVERAAVYRLLQPAARAHDAAGLEKFREEDRRMSEAFTAFAERTKASNR